MKSIVFIGRGLPEYRGMFNLDPEEMGDKRILDCAAGVSSFRSEMKRRGVNVVAVDPLYRKAAHEIEEISGQHLERYLESHEGFFGDGFADYRRRVHEMFIRDYREDPDGYVAGELPALPFHDGEFDLVLSSNLLFLYEDRLSYRFHVESIREMLRVGGEVRIFPVNNVHKRRRSKYLGGVLNELGGYHTEIQRASYRSETGCSEFLIIK